MKFLIKGLSAPQDVLKLFKAADAPDIPVRILDDTGAPVDLTTATITLECYTLVSRSTAAVKSFATTLVTAAAGESKLVPTIAAVNFGPGTYYMYAKSVDGAVTTISTNYITLKVG